MPHLHHSSWREGVQTLLNKGAVKAVSHSEGAKKLMHKKQQQNNMEHERDRILAKIQIEKNTGKAILITHVWPSQVPDTQYWWIFKQTIPDWFTIKKIF